MRILDPVLAPDVSSWCDHIKSKEFEDGGCQSVIVGLYSVLDKNGKKVLSPHSRQQCLDVMKNTKMVLQGYYYDDIILDPMAQADWVVDTIAFEGLDIKWLWADQEMWWGNWDLYYKWQGGKIPLISVPKPSSLNISVHNMTFANRLSQRFNKKVGVYTNKGFVSSWSPQMNAWLPNYDSWISQYGRQPKTQTKMTWEQFKQNWLPDYDLILSSGQLPEKVMGHQCTGDECLLPGSYNQYDGVVPFYDGRMTLDVSVFSKKFIDEIRGVVSTPVPVPAPIPVPQPIPTNQYYVNVQLINVRSGPGATFSMVGTLSLNTNVTVTNPNPTNGYVSIGTNRWVFFQYLTKK